MGDRLRAGIPSRYVTSQLGQLSLASLRGRLIEYQLRLGLGLPPFHCPNPGRGSGASGMASAGARAYNGGLRAEPPAGSSLTYLLTATAD